MVNLHPADICKLDPTYDLPIVIILLMVSDQIYGDISQTIIIGESTLDGKVGHVSGVLSMTKLAEEEGFATLFVPADDAPEASMIEDLTMYALEWLLQFRKIEVDQTPDIAEPNNHQEKILHPHQYDITKR